MYIPEAFHNPLQRALKFVTADGPGWVPLVTTALDIVLGTTVDQAASEALPSTVIAAAVFTNCAVLQTV